MGWWGIAKRIEYIYIYITLHWIYLFHSQNFHNHNKNQSPEHLHEPHGTEGNISSPSHAFNSDAPMRTLIEALQPKKDVPSEGQTNTINLHRASLMKGIAGLHGLTAMRKNGRPHAIPFPVQPPCWTLAYIYLYIYIYRYIDIYESVYIYIYMCVPIEAPVLYIGMVDLYIPI